MRNPVRPSLSTKDSEKDERRLGQMLREQKETVGLAKAGRPKIGAGGEPISERGAPTLADSGIDKKLSSRAVLVPYRGQGQKSLCRIFAVLSRDDRGKFG